LTANKIGIAVSNTPTFSGGITNTGTISYGSTGIALQSTPSVSVFDSGTITGNGTAISFASGVNTLALGPGFSIAGNVLGTGNDVFQLGGVGKGTFDLSTIGTQYTGFSNFNVVSATWVATGTSSQ